MGKRWICNRGANRHLFSVVRSTAALMSSPSFARWPDGISTLVMEIQRVFSKAVWEEKVGYCRALKAGSNIYVTCTAPVDESGKGVHAPGDAYAQAKRCL